MLKNFKKTRREGEERRRKRMAASEEEYSLEEEEYETDDEEEDDGDEDDEDDEDDDEEEDDDEPKLKYQRLGSAVTELLENDVATAMDAHDKFLALGTKKGVVAILDFNGNQTHQYRPHTHAVKQVTVDTTGEFIGSCSEDGNVVIYGLFTKELVTHSFGRPVLIFFFFLFFFFSFLLFFFSSFLLFFFSFPFFFSLL